MNTNKQAIYPIEPWTITETEFVKKNNYRNETTFSLSNGYIGTRGTFEEAYEFDIDIGLEGNFINGFYESEKIRYGEANFGSPLLSQSLLNLPDLKGLRVILDDEVFDMFTGTVEEYERKLHMREGFLNRSLVWSSPKGKKIKLEFTRVVSFEKKNIMAVRCQVTSINYRGRIAFLSKLQADVENHTRKTNPIVDYGPFGRKLEQKKLYGKNDILFYQGITQTSGLTMACGSKQRLTGSDKSCTTNIVTEDLEGSLKLQSDITPGQQLAVEKYICYTSDLDMETEKLEMFVLDSLAEAEKEGFHSLLLHQAEYVSHYWDMADVRIDGDDALQQGIRFNLFHIMQSAGRDGKTGMGAKGLSGEGYEGHYFWDTEMYVLPAFIYTNPKLAKNLLEYRYSTLKQARERARILGHDKGALFPWRTINGQEASTYYPLGTAQYHINADIAYALSLYIQVTQDMKFLEQKGTEMLIETARVWADVGSFAACKGGKYCICDVTGPDEYNVLVDNNFYTNLMARENLRAGIEAVEYLRKNNQLQLERLKEKLEFREDEVKLWAEIVEKMYFPYDEERRVYPLDDGFMMRKPWDESKIPEEKRAWLYENYHPLFIMRHRMSKQADAMLGMYLHSNFFTMEELKRNYDFYQEVTLHHSSLSTCIFGIVACAVDYYEEAYNYFAQSARMDLDDYHHNFYAGIHAANMAGTWQAIVNGFAGLRSNTGLLEFKPYLPPAWKQYAFKIAYQGSVLEIVINEKEARFTLVNGNAITFKIGGKKVSLEKEGGSLCEKI